MIAAYIWNIDHKGIEFRGLIETSIFTVATSVVEARQFISEIAPEYADLVQGEPSLITPYGTVAKLRTKLTPTAVSIEA